MLWSRSSSTARLGTTTTSGRVSVGTCTVTNVPGTSSPAGPAPSSSTVTFTVPDSASTTGLTRLMTPPARTSPAASTRTSRPTAMLRRPASGTCSTACSGSGSSTLNTRVLAPIVAPGSTDRSPTMPVNGERISVSVSCCRERSTAMVRSSSW